MTTGISSPLVIGLVALALAGCATLDHGVVDDVSVVTVPAGANVSASNGTICTSPCSISVSRREPVTITIEKPHYVTQVVVSEVKRDEAAIANASALKATPDLLGRVIDVQDGSYDGHVPNPVLVTLDAVD